MQDDARFIFEQVISLTDHLTTVSAGVLVLSVSFMTDVIERPNVYHRRLLAGAWCAFLLAIVTGLWARMAAIGALEKMDLDHVRVPAGAQIITFGIGMVLFATLAFSSLRRPR